MFGVPTAAASRAAGVERASWVLRQEGLLPALRGRGATVVNLSDLSLFQFREDEANPQARNVDVVACAVHTGADEMNRAIQDGFAILLGGDCTMGTAAIVGVARASDVPPGVVWLDGDADLNTPETTPSGYLEGMALALALGRGPGVVTDGRASTTPDRVALLGYRALDAGEKEPVHGLGLARDAEGLRSRGLAVSAADALDVAGRGGAPVVVHLDVDVLAPEVFPARRVLTGGGLQAGELGELLGDLLAHPQVVALSVAGYDPERDPDRSSARVLVALIADAVGRRLVAAGL